MVQVKVSKSIPNEGELWVPLLVLPWTGHPAVSTPTPKQKLRWSYVSQMDAQTKRTTPGHAQVPVPSMSMFSSSPPSRFHQTGLTWIAIESRTEDLLEQQSETAFCHYRGSIPCHTSGVAQGAPQKHLWPLQALRPRAEERIFREIDSNKGGLSISTIGLAHGVGSNRKLHRLEIWTTAAFIFLFLKAVVQSTRSPCIML